MSLLLDKDFMKRATPEAIQRHAEKADVNARGGAWGSSPLHMAADFNENPAVVKTLVQLGADVNARDRYSENSPLHRAAWFNKASAVIKALIDEGADVNAPAEDGYAPLHDAACNNKNPAVVLTLLDAGADANVITEDGKTALDLIQENAALKDTEAHKKLRELSQQR